ncbi:MAG TPA: 4-(cytidine 5'-diphospho)-2-C-methyl-D-erythritol kinase [Sphingomicrobium sp.]|nr:4-(cytidine 5'-diphospho)-2-C-methyl-D-erythritol kinase [Sphingomicrobium sp.]
MSTLTERAYAKLNLALHVRGKLPDGRHAIETVFAFCEDGDELTAEPADEFSLTLTGPFAGDLKPDDNLVLKAVRVLHDAADVEGGATMCLDKRLPIASGIGGGSADAGAALRLLTKMWKIDPGLGEEVAPSLGADVPVCLLSQSSRGDGVGDQLEPMELGFTGTPVLLVNPRLPLSTGAVFAQWDGVDRGPLGDWHDGRNDLEAPAIDLAPAIADVLEWLRGQPGATFVRMSGSGATCFALLDNLDAREEAAKACPAHWWHLATRLR